MLCRGRISAVILAVGLAAMQNEDVDSVVKKLGDVTVDGTNVCTSPLDCSLNEGDQLFDSLGEMLCLLFPALCLNGFFMTSNFPVFFVTSNNL